MRKAWVIPRHTNCNQWCILLLVALQVKAELHKRHLSLLFSVLSSKNSTIKDLSTRQTAKILTMNKVSSAKCNTGNARLVSVITYSRSKSYSPAQNHFDLELWYIVFTDSCRLDIAIKYFG